MTESTEVQDPFELKRFLDAQERVYADVLAELRDGRKRTHWIWFIFPQIAGLGYSTTSAFYAIKSRTEAQHYLAHPVLGPRLRECAGLVLAIQGLSANAIFGTPDDIKLRSSMTLFAEVDPPGSIFRQVLDKYFAGAPDQRTLELLDT